MFLKHYFYNFFPTQNFKAEKIFIGILKIIVLFVIKISFYLLDQKTKLMKALMKPMSKQVVSEKNLAVFFCWNTELTNHETVRLQIK